MKKLKVADKSKTKMPAGIKKKCSTVIHTAAVAAGTSAAIPIPVADRIPITAAQVGMVIALGKVFDITISESVAKAVIGCGLAQQVGQAIVDGILKSIPGVNVLIAPTVCTITAAGFTEALGWVIADDFYRMSKGEQPDTILDEVPKLEELFKTVKKSKKKTETKNTSKTKKRSNSGTKKVAKKK